MRRSVRAFIGLGANLGEPLTALRGALAALDALPGSRLAAVSGLYRSAPIESSGPDYLNAVAALDTELEPQPLLMQLQAIEQSHGRERPYRFAPRTLDLDLLLFAQQRIDTPTLTVPHPRLHQRAFALLPLLEIEPTLTAPGLGALADAVPRVADQRIERDPTRLDLRLRPIAERDIDTVIDGWYATNRAAYPYVAEIQRHTHADDARFFRERLLPSCAVTLACDLTDRALAFVATESGWVRHLSVFEGERRRGIGSLLIDHAKTRWPGGLRLYTFQRNDAARAFYARHGFTEVALGVSPAPESEPDVLLAWPAPTASWP